MIRLKTARLHRRDLRTRLPFRYGIVTMTELPHVFLTLECGGLTPPWIEDRKTFKHEKPPLNANSLTLPQPQPHHQSSPNLRHPKRRQAAALQGNLYDKSTFNHENFPHDARDVLSDLAGEVLVIELDFQSEDMAAFTCGHQGANTEREFSADAYE